MTRECNDIGAVCLGEMSDIVPVVMKLADVKKLKVVELRVKLKERGLDTKGLKAELVARLWSAVEQSADQAPGGGGEDGSSVVEGMHVDIEESHEHASETFKEDLQQGKTVAIEVSNIGPSRESNSAITSSGDGSVTDESGKVSVDYHASSGRAVKFGAHQNSSRSTSPELTLALVNGSPACHPTTSDEVSHTDTAVISVDDTTEPRNVNKPPVAGQEDRPPILSPSLLMHTESSGTEVHQQQLSGDTISDQTTVKALNTLKDNHISKRPLEGVRDRGYYEFKEEVQYNRAKNPDSNTEANEDIEVDDQLVVLDSYNSDLHFKVGEDGMSGEPLFWEKFPLLWSGCRLSHGVQYGKVSFEVKYVKRLVPCALEDGTDPDPHVLRVGWSTNNSSLQLGETELSYAFDSRGLKVTQGREVEFGEPFSEGDIISCYAWLSDTEESELSFHKNGRSLGVAFRLDPSQQKGHTIYPHILCKNCSVSLNLDPVSAPWYCGPPGFFPLIALQPHERTQASRPPASKEDCEVVMMVGLPGSGKTHWAQAIMAQHPDKHYNLLSTDTILACMKGGSVPKEVVLQQATQCLTQLIRVASSKRRNYILDQANVYLSARRHKMLLFSGFRRQAVVVFPSHQEWKRRLAQQQKDQSKEVPEDALLKLKVSFTLPETGDLLEEVSFVELPKEEAQRFLTGYKEEARQLLPTPPKRKKPRHKHRPTQPRWNIWNTSYKRHPGWMNQFPNVPPPYWGPPPRQDMYGHQRSRNYYGYPAAQWNTYYGAPWHFSDQNYTYGTDQGYW